MFKKRIDALGVINGTIGIVTTVNPTTSGAGLSIDVRGRAVSFATNDIADDDGRTPLAHAYATTVYSAQGATVDSAFVIADHTMKRNDIYVAASRARNDSCIYVDQKGVEKAARSRMALADESRAAIPEERLRRYLSEAWAQAQTKRSTRDFLAKDLPTAEVLRTQTGPHPSTGANRVRLPEMEYSR